MVNREKKNAINRAYYHRHKKRISQKQKLRSREDYKNNKHLKLAAARYMRIAHPIEYMLSRTKGSAKRRGLDFNLCESDIIIPNVCPVLGLKLEIAQGAAKDNSPSIDRIDNSKGYTKDNIRIISWRANKLKSNATKDEIEKILNYIIDNEIKEYLK